MANSARNTTGNMPRFLQLGLDRSVDHHKKSYKGPGSIIFNVVKTDKGFFEAAQVAGMGMATIKGEGAAFSLDSRDQNWVFNWPIITYGKSARITMEAIEDNQYEDVLIKLGREMAKALEHCKDYQMAAVLNNGFSATTNPDSKALFATDHPLQAGGTSSNLLSPGLDLSEDAIESVIHLIDGFLNPDGLLSMYDSKDLIIPQGSRFEAERIVNSRYRPGTPDNDINAIVSQSAIKRVIPWKRLTDTDSFYITTTAEDGLTLIERRKPETESFKEPTTKDVLLTTDERYVAVCMDWHAVAASPGI